MHQLVNHVFIEGNLFIPLNCITNETVQLNVGKPVKKHQIPAGLSNICGILNKQIVIQMNGYWERKKQNYSQLEVKIGCLKRDHMI